MSVTTKDPQESKTEEKKDFGKSDRKEKNIRRKTMDEVL